MGATLPLLVSAVAGPSQDFGRALGRLYGWNTLGAVAGALLGESLLFAHLGLRGSGLFAAALNGTAALGATALARSWRPDDPPASEASPRSSAARLPWGRLGVAGLCGAILLSLEVVWFRFLQLFVVGTSLTFAVMLAVVLLGIGLGGLAAGALLARRPDAYRWFPALSLGAGCLTVVGYVRFDTVFDLVSRELLIHSPLVTLWLGLWLMLPTCFVSGMLFTLLGRALKEDLEIEHPDHGRPDAREHHRGRARRSRRGIRAAARPGSREVGLPARARLRGGGRGRRRSHRLRLARERRAPLHGGRGSGVRGPSRLVPVRPDGSGARGPGGAPLRISRGIGPSPFARG